MATVHPRSRSTTPAQPPEKKVKLDAVHDEDAPADRQQPPAPSSSSKKQPKHKKNKKIARRAPEPFSHDDILSREVIALLGKDYADEAKAADLDWNSPFELSQHLELTVSVLSPSTGMPTPSLAV